MLSERTSDPAPVLPVELRAAIDVVVKLSQAAEGQTAGRVLGQRQLTRALESCVPVTESNSMVIALGAPPDALRSAVASTMPDRIVTMVGSRFDRSLKPFRAPGRVALPTDLPRAEWDAMGYARVAATGVQGLAAILWSMGERVLRRLGRPDLADRCRIAMLRTLVAAHPSLPAAVRVLHYQRVTT
ncbi:MAG TPA: hypothetical protein VIL01_13200 [Thermomicrobiales bacterium]